MDPRVNPADLSGGVIVPRVTVGIFAAQCCRDGRRLRASAMTRGSASSLAGAIKDHEETVGNQTRVKVVKNKLAPPFKQVEFDIMYGEGVSKNGELIDLGVKAGVVEKSGTWFSYDSQRIGQGRENAKAFLKANPDIAAKIETAIRQNAGLIAERILAGDERGENEDAAE